MKSSRSRTRESLLIIFLLYLQFSSGVNSERPLLCQDQNGGVKNFGLNDLSQTETKDGIEAPLNKPKCRLFISSSNDKEDESGIELKCQRIHGNVYRLTGEYGVLTMNCTAPFLIDLDYDGFKPTEAVEIDYWKNVIVLNSSTLNISRDKEVENLSPNGTRIVIESYGLLVKIWSIQALFKKYQTFATEDKSLPLINYGIDRPIVYSRTGRFTIRDMWNEHFGLFEDFYFFFEEPLMTHKFAWMTTEFTSLPLIVTEKAKVQILVPCRPSHYVTAVDHSFEDQGHNDYQYQYEDENQGQHEGHHQGQGRVTLTMIDKRDPEYPARVYPESTVTFEPTTGFLVDVSNSTFPWTNKSLKNFDFECEFRTSNSTAVSWRPNWNVQKYINSDERSVLGVGALNMTRNTNSFRVSNTVASQDSEENWTLYSSLACLLNESPTASARFLSLGFSRSSEIRFGRQFLLPMYSNMSYWLQWGRRRVPGSLDLVIDRESHAGILLCTDGKSYEIDEYVVGLNKQVWLLAAGFDFVHAPPYASVKHDADIMIRMDEPRTSFNLQQIQTILYTAYNFTFSCRIGPDLVLPVLWFARRQNGTTHLDTQTKNGLSKLNGQLEPDVQQIFCTASLFQSQYWRQASFHLNLTEGSPPKLTNGSTKFRLRADGVGQVIKCEYSGDPKPVVWWERNGTVLPGTRRIELATYELSPDMKIGSDASIVGEYLCRAKNIYGESQQVFTVEMVEALIVNDSTSSSVEYWQIILIICGVAILVGLVVLGIFQYLRLKVGRKILTAEEVREFRMGAKLGVDNDYTTPLSMPYQNLYEVQSQDFTVDNDTVLGFGAYGVVKKGWVRGQAVAVKTTKVGAPAAYLKTLLSELKIMIYVGPHPSLVQLIGASTLDLTRGVAFVFVELCSLGNLLSYLRDHRAQFSTTEYHGFADDQSLNVGQLHKWALEITQGLSFLSSKNVIHGDLAARNILLTADRTAKITDFGLSRQLLHYTNYTKKSQEPLPFRWLSFESLTNLEFSCKSDIWSLGVCFWEIYSLGQVPFPAASWGDEFIDSIRRGLRLSCPATISASLFSSLLLPCWTLEPSDRPNCREIEAHLDQVS